MVAKTEYIPMLQEVLRKLSVKLNKEQQLLHDLPESQVTQRIHRQHIIVQLESKIASTKDYLEQLEGKDK